MSRLLCILILWKRWWCPTAKKAAYHLSMVPLSRCLLTAPPSFALPAITTCRQLASMWNVENWTLWRKSAYFDKADNDDGRPLSCITTTGRDYSVPRVARSAGVAPSKQCQMCTHAPYLIHWHPPFTVHRQNNVAYCAPPPLFVNYVGIE